MISIAKARFIRVSPRKVRSVIDLVRGKPVREAFNILENLNRGASKYVIKILKSAVSNSKQFATDEGNLYVSKIVADSGPMLKRFKAAAFGRAVIVRHRLCHITVELDELKKAALPAGANRPVKGKEKRVKKAKTVTKKTDATKIKRKKKIKE